jgi:ribosomal-protein-alanine N-acetyltransferase
MTIILEDASLRDLDRLCEIEKECFDEEAFSKREIACFLTDYNSVSLVAKEKDKVVGFVIGTICFNKHTVSGHIFTIDVSPEHRRKGIAQMLFSAVEDIFVQKGVKDCVLEAREDNIAALSLYRKLGYTEMGKLKNYYGRANGVCLKKVLI